MIKRCTNCNAEYVARWRNEPTTVCPACRVDVVLCTACATVLRHAVDAQQLTLWPNMRPVRSGPLPTVDEHEPHFSHGHRATNLTRRKYPYQ